MLAFVLVGTLYVETEMKDSFLFCRLVDERGERIINLIFGNNLSIYLASLIPLLAYLLRLFIDNL